MLKRITAADLTNVRASKAWEFDSDGNLAEYANNVIRVAHEPVTGTPLGLRVEGARTNSLRNPRAEGSTAGVIGSGGAMPTNWVQAGIPAGVSLEIMGTGTQNGMPYVEMKISGTNAGGTAFSAIIPESITQVVASATQRWAGSFFLSLTAGTIPGQFNVTTRGRTSGGSSVAGDTSSTNVASLLTSTLQRFTRPHTIVDATSARVTTELGITIPTGAVNFTFRVAIPQLELGAFSSSPILPPAGAPAASTRSADAPTFDISSLSVYNPQGTTVVFEGQTSNQASIVSEEFGFTLFNNADNYLGIVRGANPQVRSRAFATSTNTNVGSGYPPAAQPLKIAFTFNDTTVRGSVNGGTATGATVSTVRPRGITAFQPGRVASAGYWFGTIKSIRIDGTRFSSDAQLQALSS